MIDLAITELHKGFNLFNQHLFESELTVPAILVQNQGRRKDILGWCTVREIWTDENKTLHLYEINLTAEYLNRAPLDIMETLLHEMVHLYNNVKGIKDTSRGTTYHNKDFKAQAERRGLIVEHHKKLGWAVTSLKPETTTLIQGWGIDPKAFRIAREFEQSSSAKKSGLKYTCPECEVSVKATKKVNIMCLTCTQILVSDEEPEEDGEDQTEDEKAD